MSFKKNCRGWRLGGCHKGLRQKINVQLLNRPKLFAGSVKTVVVTTHIFYCNFSETFSMNNNLCFRVRGVVIRKENYFTFGEQLIKLV